MADPVISMQTPRWFRCRTFLEDAPARVEWWILGLILSSSGHVGAHRAHAYTGFGAGDHWDAACGVRGSRFSPRTVDPRAVTCADCRAMIGRKGC